ncbi:MAG: prmC [Bacteroidetes bacterium]|nr:prmC [Bacteroidota bacterium]
MQNYQEYVCGKLRGIYPENEIHSLFRILLEEISGMQAAFFLSDKSKQLNEQQEKRLDDILSRLQKSEPLQYIIGETEFYGLQFSVSPDVLIPRPETEELVDWVVQEYRFKPVHILDIGTGSGCIAVALAKLLPLAAVEAWDVSAEALAMAEKNAGRNGVDVAFQQVDVLSVNKDRGFPLDIIVSNPPYVLDSEKKDMHRNVLEHEPHLALFVEDDDPLLFYRKIAQFGKQSLKPFGTLFYEINAAKGQETVELLTDLGYRDVELRRDLSGNDRMVKAVWNG